MPNRLVAGRHGQFLCNTNDRYIGRSLEFYGEYCEHEADLYRQLLRPGDTVVEVGANIGALTVPLARAVGPRGSVIALEPQRVVFQMLCGSAALNELRNVHAYHLAVGSRNGGTEVPMANYDAPGNFGAIALGTDQDWRRSGETMTEPVSIVTLDYFLKDNKAARLLKIDCEGMETEVLDGASQFIFRHRPIIYAENDRRDGAEELVRLLRLLDYRLWWHTPPLYNPANFAGNPTDIFPATVSINVLAIPTELDIDVPFEPVTDPYHKWMPEP